MLKILDEHDNTNLLTINQRRLSPCIILFIFNMLRVWYFIGPFTTKVKNYWENNHVSCGPLAIRRIENQYYKESVTLKYLMRTCCILVIVRGISEKFVYPKHSIARHISLARRQDGDTCADLILFTANTDFNTKLTNTELYLQPLIPLIIEIGTESNTLSLKNNS